MRYARYVVTTRFLYRAYRSSYTGYESGVFRARPRLGSERYRPATSTWELASADRLRRIRDVEKHFRSGDMADSPGLSGGNVYFPDCGYAIARQQFECNVFRQLVHHRTCQRGRRGICSR